MKIQISRWFVLGATLATAGLALAQGGPPNGGGQPGTGGGQGGFGGGNYRNMTPQQRQQMQAQMREQQLRGALGQIGADEASQTAVLAFVKEQSDAATALQPKIAAMRALFRGTGGDDTAIKSALADYRSAVDVARKTRDAQTADLDKQISFSTKPKLEALLTMLGVIGDETAFVANLSGEARLPGGRGGGGYGGRGGRGGQGGGRNGGDGAGGATPDGAGGPPPAGDQGGGPQGGNMTPPPAPQE